MDGKYLYTVAEASRVLWGDDHKAAQQKTRRLVKAMDLPVVHIGRSWYIKRDTLQSEFGPGMFKDDNF